MTALHPPLDAETAGRAITLTFGDEPPQRMTLGDLFEANEALDEEERRDILLTLMLGQPYQGGGGAAAAFTLALAS